MREHELSEFELEREGFKIRIKKNSPAQPAGPFTTPVVPQAPFPPIQNPVVPLPTQPEPVETTEAPASDEVDFAIVKSPIVGTFFRASEPGASPFVDVGSEVKKGQVLCIIEAMKLMNEIDSEYDGEIVNIYVENGQPVQYGERLFEIRTK